MKPSTVTSTSTVYTGRCRFGGFIVATDGVNDPTVTIYDNTAASGTILIPATTFDASALGLNGVMVPYSPIECSTGIHVVISVGGGGSCNVTTYYTVSHN